jgi:uncharacterized OB-fold protein
MTVDLAQRAMLPSPGWRNDTEEYWLAAGKKQLVVQRCSSCGFHRSPPNPACYNCNSMEYAWSPVPGTGMVFSFTWADYPPPPEGERNITVVELDGTEGEPVRVITWVVDVPRDQLVCGLPVEVTFLPLDEEVAVPAWRPRR